MMTDSYDLPEIRLVDFSHFEGLGYFPRFPENSNIVVPLPSVDLANALVIFISHCWLRGWSGAEGWDGRPHPDNRENEKYRLCVAGINKMRHSFARRLELCYVWLDYGCINQDGDPAGELKQLDEIIKCSDCIFTPIVDHDEWEFVPTSAGYLRDYKAKKWCNEQEGYLNRGWCRVEMFYAANIPLSDSTTASKIEKFDAALKVAASAGRRPHVLFGTRELTTRRPPVIMPPLQNCYFEEFHPMKGYLSVETDRAKIGSLVSELLPYMKTVTTGYEGGTTSSGEYDGYGKLVYKNGDVYKGNWKKHKKHGKGEYQYIAGSCYVGDWNEDKMHGKAVYSMACGDVYDGEYKNGKKDGYGVYSYMSGALYEGNWKEDKMHGEGKMQLANGDLYHGSYNMGLKEGRGIYSYASGAKYDGEWSGDKMHGQQGQYLYANGDRFVGPYVNGKRMGKGRYLYASTGKIYESNWADDKRLGDQVLVDSLDVFTLS
jgi:hypothetical protein